MTTLYIFLSIIYQVLMHKSLRLMKVTSFLISRAIPLIHQVRNTLTSMKKRKKEKGNEVCLSIKNVLCIIVIVLIIEIGLHLRFQHTHVSVGRLTEQ